MLTTPNEVIQHTNDCIVMDPIVTTTALESIGRMPYCWQDMLNLTTLPFQSWKISIWARYIDEHVQSYGRELVVNCIVYVIIQNYLKYYIIQRNPNLCRKISLSWVSSPGACWLSHFQNLSSL